MVNGWLITVVDGWVSTVMGVRRCNYTGGLITVLTGRVVSGLEVTGVQADGK